jgi:leucyl-tRNA synthetase
MVLMDGSAMSKSKGNLVRLSEQLEEHGVDAVRLTMSFAGPPEDDIDWKDVSPHGSSKFLARAWRLAGDVTSEPGVDATTGDASLRRITHHFLAEVPAVIESFKFNVAVARIMELVNATRKTIDSGVGGADPAVREATEAVAVALSLFAPYTAEDMWEKLGHQPTVALAGWQDADPALLVEESVTAIVQVNGKVRDRLEVAPDIAAADLEALARALPSVDRHIGAAQVRTVVVRAPRLVNFVVQ